MSMLGVRPEVGDTLEPDPEALIEEARRRHRRRRARAGATILLLIGLGVGVGTGFFGGGSGGTRLSTGGGGRAGGASSTAGSNPSRVVVSPLLPASGYLLGIRHGQIAVITELGWTSNGCEMRLLDARTLHIEAVDHGCAGLAPVARGLVVDDRATADQIHVSTTNAVTGKTTVGPTLMTRANWDWAHSGAVEGNGALWIYGLGPFGHTSVLLEVSTKTGALLRRFHVPAGEDPFMAVNADGFWVTQSAYGGSSCARECTLWHVAPGSGRLIAVRSLGVRTQWLRASADSIYADVLTGTGDRFTQAIWRLVGPGARVVYKTPATLLPSTDFGIGTGYFVIGNAQQGYYTLTQLGRGKTPAAVGGCDAAAAIRLIRISPETGKQSYVATLPRSDAGQGLDCHLSQYQAVVYGGSFYLLAKRQGQLIEYQQVVRLPT